jgi:hypothetical protein
VAAARAGDEVIVLPGTYSVTYNVATNRPITIEGQPGQPRPTLVGAASLGGATLTTSGGAVVNDLTIEANQSHPALSIDGGIAENLVATAQGVALDVRTDFPGTLVRTVLAVDQAASGQAVSFRDGGGGGQGGALVYNLTAIGQGAGASAVYGNNASGTVSIKDSIASGPAGDISTRPGSNPIQVSYSDFRTSASSGYVDGGGNLVAAPRFVNSSAGNFHEAPGSPTIDAGSTDWLLSSTDLDGNSRNSGRAPDMGAYEYVAGSGAPGAAGPGGTPAGGGSGTAASGGGSSQTLPPASRPVPGVSVTVRTVSGIVLVQLPRSSTFVPLATAAEVPVGSVVNAIAGKMLLTSAVNHHGGTKTGAFSGGSFQVRQPNARLPQTVLRLVGGSFAACSRTGGRAVAMMARAARGRRSPRRVVRQLWGSDHGGRFVTVGRTASAAVRGTLWLTQDRCDGTLIRVVRGRVVVHTAGHRHNVVLGPGQSYFARA